MQLQVVSYDTLSLSDANFSGFFPKGTVLLQADSEPVFAERHAAPPAFVDKKFKPLTVPLHVQILSGTYHSQIAVLKATFDTRDRTLKKLLVQDSANGNKQWYVMCTCIEQALTPEGNDVSECLFNLWVPDPVWYSNTQFSDAWNISATGQTHAIDLSTHGTLRLAPVLRITPTTTKGGGFSYFRFARFYNPTALAMTNYPLDLSASGWDTASLVADTTVSNQINNVAGITAAAATIDIDTPVGGGLPTPAGIGYLDTEQISWTGNSGTQLTGCTRGINGTTAATHADNTVIRRSKLAADGRDVRVFVDGKEANRWLGSMNSAATKVWISGRLAAGIDLTINAMLIGDTSLTFQNTRANLLAFSRLPPKGIGLLENEVVTWTGKTSARGAAGKLTGLTRGAKQTTAAGHAAAIVLHRIEHDVVLAYGDQTLGLPTSDDTQKPLFALTSTNTSWVYPGDGYSSASSKRSGEWKPSLLASLAVHAYRISQFYTADHAGVADPASEMGMRIASWLLGTLQKAENAQIEWRLSHPAGVTTVTATGEARRTSASWPAVADFQYSNDGRSWITKWTEAAPTQDSAWHAWAAHSSVALGATYKFIRFLFSGAVGAGAGFEADSECDTITLTLDSANVPQGALGGEWGSSYHLAGTITNNLTGDAISINFMMRFGQTLEIDCLNKKVTYLEDNTPQYAAIAGGFSSVRQTWLDLVGGVSNTLQYDDAAGTGNITITILYQDRQN